jgi:hypothetical protein
MTQLDLNSIPSALKEVPATQYDVRMLQLQIEQLERKMTQAIYSLRDNHKCEAHSERIERLEVATEKLVKVTENHQKYIWMVAGALSVITILLNFMKEIVKW